MQSKYIHVHSGCVHAENYVFVVQFFKITKYEQCKKDQNKTLISWDGFKLEHKNKCVNNAWAYYQVQAIRRRQCLCFD